MFETKAALTYGFVTLALFLPLAYAAPAQHTLFVDPYPGKPRLSFRSDGTFKITVFSDLHYGENPSGPWGPEQDINSTCLMKLVLKAEKPDYVVLNGDLITDTFRENSTLLIDKIMASLNSARVPFSSSHGNHDNQANITHMEEILREQKVSPLSYTRPSPPGVGGEGGPGNYWVPIYYRKSDPAPTLVLWFFDSRGGFSPGPDSTRIPDWVDATVGDWIISETRAMSAAWGPAHSRAALAFVHIPPHIATNLWLNLNSTEDPGLNADSLDGGGSVQASVFTSDHGKDNVFWNTLNANVKNLRAVISGHDHGNEWCSRDPVKNVMFCFTKHSGYGGYTGDGWGYGVRNLVFSSPHPRAGVETWIRMENGETHARITL